jgi:hypothetical protein
VATSAIKDEKDESATMEKAPGQVAAAKEKAQEALERALLGNHEEQKEEADPLESLRAAMRGALSARAAEEKKEEEGLEALKAAMRRELGARASEEKRQEAALREKAREALEATLLSNSKAALKEKAKDALEQALLSKRPEGDAIREKAQDALERALLSDSEGREKAIREKAQAALESALLRSSSKVAEPAPVVASSPIVRAETPHTTKSKRRIIGGVVRAPTATKSVPTLRLDLDSDSDAGGKMNNANKRDSSLARVYNALGADFHNLDVTSPKQWLGERAPGRKSEVARSRSSADLKASLRAGGKVQTQNKKLFGADLNPLWAGLLETSFEVALGKSSAMAMDLSLDCPTKASSATSPLQRSASLGALKITQKQAFAGVEGTPERPHGEWLFGHGSASLADGSSSGSLAWSRHMAKSAAKRGLQMATAF